MIAVQLPYFIAESESIVYCEIQKQNMVDGMPNIPCDNIIDMTFQVLESSIFNDY